MGRVRVARAAGLAAVVAAALLGACTVEVEGAPCRVPGDSADCPGGQACGNDLRCSERALACASSGARCTPGVGGACLDPSGVETAGAAAQARQCTADDPVCGRWVVQACTPGGLSCAVRAPAGGVPGAWCVCPDQPPGSRELFVRPEGSSRAAAPFATGAASPVACSFRRLTDALGAAGDIVAGDPLAVATVTALGAGAAATRTFSAAATGETFPLVVPGRVTLGSDAQAGGGRYEIVFDAMGAATAPVELHSGGALAGFTVRNGAGDAAHDAIALKCGGTDPAVLTSVVLDGAGAGSARLGRGLVVDGACGVAAKGTQVRNFSVAGVVVDSTAGAQFGLTNGAITGCGDGVKVHSGRLFLDGARVSGNSGMGIRANDTFDGIPRVEVRRSKVIGNGDTGIAIVNAPEIRVTATTVFANGAVYPWGGSLLPSSVSRTAGGLVLWGTPPAAASFEFGRNRIYANRGDQILTLGTVSTWVLDGPDHAPGPCGSDTSGPLYTVIGCYDPPLGTYRGVVAVDAGVSARNLWWSTITPSQSIDVERFPSGTIDTSGVCADASTLSCTSEDPTP